MTDFFKHDYIEYDECGLKEVRCMASGKVIGRRTERESKKFPGKTLMQFYRYADYREIPYILSDGSVSFLIFCDQYKDHELNDEEVALVNDQIRRARIMEMKYSGRSGEFIEKIISGIENKKIIRRMTESEVSDRFANTVSKGA